ncbi:MAG: YebC/PmpR family DNA-binding transcriptional regulator [Candidatus Yanofskybacteria bacterium CG10_big_fil_rev_8_21_14_0_10_37_15]|uniref:YebC/PmpR family DNA-binding transcriptional regulator n=1 Tax=Candidatus Yanofskybacteria bacterium CG10_big_fil_rev_8_21_14_0_10_37_15 TaxID=1975097 RepID=A0A2H0R7E8_9BACT|nr:MAG: YebC/PmpR family DNA-binding transcriptional regulator [Candidatus Yanofskybacteria bacterium CG10_big_fil_rev_8_21_14_0_10_37_15]
MSGHSKWSQIKHKKALTDKKKGQVFSKISKLLTLAAKKGTDPKTNPELFQILERAREVNMPGNNIERAIKKVSDKNQDQLEELAIEALGPGGVALKINVITDNGNRTIAEIKKILSENNSKMVQPGSLSWMFKQKLTPNQSDQDKIEKLFEDLDNQDEVEDVSSNLNNETS